MIPSERRWLSGRCRLGVGLPGRRQWRRDDCSGGSPSDGGVASTAANRRRGGNNTGGGRSAVSPPWRCSAVRDVNTKISQIEPEETSDVCYDVVFIKKLGTVFERRRRPDAYSPPRNFNNNNRDDDDSCSNIIMTFVWRWPRRRRRCPRYLPISRRRRRIQLARCGSDGWAVALGGSDDDDERGATLVWVRLCKCARPRWVSRVGRRRSIDNHPLRRTTLFYRTFTSVGNRFPAAVIPSATSSSARQSPTQAPCAV